MNAGDTFLHAPKGELIIERLKPLTKSAVKKMKRTFGANLKQEQRSELLWTETVHSAAIEGEDRFHEISLHQRALAEFLDKPLTPDSLLEMHLGMMAGQDHASPGRYRDVEVTIAQQHLPTAEVVPSLMDELFTFMGKTRNNQVARATWAHVQFENIHPFADGNGRTGRALLLHILGVPIPISRFIQSERSIYYHLFRQQLWTEWLEWMTKGILIECNIPYSPVATLPPPTGEAIKYPAGLPRRT